jgi:fucose 4-O-acetylase-like acetyltransferase
MCGGISNTNGSHRIGWLDTLRAVAIILVLVGHKTNSTIIEKVIYSFHVPLFFWISGFVFDESRYKSIASLLVKKVRGLVVPYFAFALISFLFWLIVVRSLSLRGQSLSLNPWMPFVGIFYGVGIDPWRNPMDIALWFLPCLFITDLLFWFLNSCVSQKFRLLAVISCSMAGYCMSLWLPLRLPWSADVSLMAIVFYYIGNLTRSYDEQLLPPQPIYRVLIVCILSSIVFVLSSANGKIDMNYNYYGNPILFLISACSGIYLFYYLIRQLPTARWLSYIGQNTIIIVGLAGISTFIIRGLNYLIFRSLPSEARLGVPMSILFTFLEIGLLVPAIYIINRYFPFIIGRHVSKRGIGLMKPVSGKGQ